MIRLLHRGWPGCLVEPREFEKYMQKLGAEAVNRERNLGEELEKRDYALWEYSIGIRYSIRRNVVEISAEGREEDVDRFEKRFVKDCLNFGKGYD